MKRVHIWIPAVSAMLMAFALWFSPGKTTPGPPQRTMPSPQAVEASPGLPRELSAVLPEEPQEKPSEELPWNLTLVNADHPLPDGFSISTTRLTNGLEFDSRAYSALTTMLSAGQAEGLSFVVCSAYRTVEYQQTLFQNQVNRYIARGYSQQEAEELTAQEIMPPGTSEHNLGLAADIVAVSYQMLDNAQADTAEQRWLMEHCWEYGFILRYPEDKQDVTGIIYEPWHYRYVGVDAALSMRDSGLCLEEYLHQLAE